MADRGSKPKSWWDFHHDWQQDEGEVIEEITLTIYVNGVEFISIMGTPLNQDWLAVGFLINERIISNLDEIADLRISRDGCCIDVWLTHRIEKPSKMYLTSGCGGGLIFDDPRLGVEPFDTTLSTTPDIILEAFNILQTKESLYARARGVHAAGLVDLHNGELIMVAEDIGRHNSIDKLRGACLLAGVETTNRALLTTGRISSEMLRKGAVMGCPVIASRTSPTSFALELAETWKITLVGYARHGKLRVYCNPERLGLEPKPSKKDQV
jgi:FdhD protein